MHSSSLECFCWGRGGGWLGSRPERGGGEGGGESSPAPGAPGSGGEITPPSSSGQKSVLPSPPAPRPGNTAARGEGREGGSCPLPTSRPWFWKLPGYPIPGGLPLSVAPASGSSSVDVGPRSIGPQRRRRRQNGKRKKESSLLRGPSGSWSVAADSRPPGSTSPTQGPGLAEKEDLPPAGSPGTWVLGGGWVRVGRPGGAARGGPAEGPGGDRAGRRGLWRWGSQDAQARALGTHGSQCSRSRRTGRGWEGSGRGGWARLVFYDEKAGRGSHQMQGSVGAQGGGQSLRSLWGPPQFPWHAHPSLPQRLPRAPSSGTSSSPQVELLKGQGVGQEDPPQDSGRSRLEQAAPPPPPQRRSPQEECPEDRGQALPGE